MNKQEIENIIAEYLKNMKWDEEIEKVFDIPAVEIRAFLDKEVNKIRSFVPFDRKNNLSTDPNTGEDGQLCVVNGILKIYHSGSWNNV